MFSPKELYACATQVERRNSCLKKEAFVSAIDRELGQSLFDGTYKFLIRKEGEFFLNGRKRTDFGYLCQNLVLRKLFRNIRRIYSVQQADRNTIVSQMKILMSEDVDMWVVRLDVRHFYETIDKHRLLLKMEDDARLSHHTIMLLQSLLNDPEVIAISGVPRGLAVSAAIAEMYMKYFDLEMRRVAGVYYYARYVDDVIVFCSSEQSKDKAWGTAVESLKKLGLELHEEKSYVWSTLQKGDALTYLGYTFTKSGKKVEVTIAEKKQKVIKTRLTRTFVRYAKDRDYELLKLRIKFLTGNFTLCKADMLTPIKVGIYFNYKMATETAALDAIDNYYQRLLHCRRGRLGARIGLLRDQVKDLEKYSFRFGYDHHVTHHFTAEQMKKITNCWL